MKCSTMLYVFLFLTTVIYAPSKRPLNLSIEQPSSPTAVQDSGLKDYNLEQQKEYRFICNRMLLLFSQGKIGIQELKQFGNRLQSFKCQTLRSLLTQELLRDFQNRLHYKKIHAEMDLNRAQREYFLARCLPTPGDDTGNLESIRSIRNIGLSPYERSDQWFASDGSTSSC